MLNQIIAASLALVAVRALKVTQENSEYIEDMEQYGYFHENNAVYNQKTAAEKLDDLWKLTIEDDTMIDYYWKDFAKQFTARGNGSHCNSSDEMRQKRLKVAHTQGVVAKCRWEPIQTEWGYTGFYGDGTDNALIRFSQTSMITEDSPGLLPSLAIKALRTGHRSQNLLAMPSFKETDSWDFFEYTMKNRVEPFDPVEDADLMATIITKLTEGDNRPFSTAVCPFAEYNETEDIPQEDVVMPYEVWFTSPFKGHEY